MTTSDVQERWGVWCTPKGAVDKAQWLSDYAGIDAGSKPAEFLTAQAAEECAVRSRLRNASWTYEARLMLVPAGWEDVDDEWTARIKAAHPTRSDSHEQYSMAMQMVGHRHSKGELVSLVNWLLTMSSSMVDGQLTALDDIDKLSEERDAYRAVLADMVAGIQGARDRAVETLRTGARPTPSPGVVKAMAGGDSLARFGDNSPPEGE